MVTIKTSKCHGFCFYWKATVDSQLELGQFCACSFALLELNWVLLHGENGSVQSQSQPVRTASALQMQWEHLDEQQTQLVMKSYLSYQTLQHNRKGRSCVISIVVLIGHHVACVVIVNFCVISYHFFLSCHQQHTVIFMHAAVSSSLSASSSPLNLKTWHGAEGCHHTSLSYCDASGLQKLCAQKSLDSDFDLLLFADDAAAGADQESQSGQCRPWCMVECC